MFYFLCDLLSLHLVRQARSNTKTPWKHLRKRLSQQKIRDRPLVWTCGCFSTSSQLSELVWTCCSEHRCIALISRRLHGRQRVCCVGFCMPSWLIKPRALPSTAANTHWGNSACWIYCRFFMRLWHYPVYELFKTDAKSSHAPLIYVELITGSFVVGVMSGDERGTESQIKHTIWKHWCHFSHDDPEACLDYCSQRQLAVITLEKGTFSATFGFLKAWV